MTTKIVNFENHKAVIRKVTFYETEKFKTRARNP